MAIFIPNVGENKMLEYILGKASAGTVTLKLYTNNYDPIATSVASSFTECTIAGYAAKSIATSDWGSVSTNGSGKAQSVVTPSDFSFTGSGTVYGYYVVDSAGVLLFAEKFPAARTIASGDNMSLTVTFTAVTE